MLAGLLTAAAGATRRQTLTVSGGSGSCVASVAVTGSKAPQWPLQGFTHSTSCML